MTPPVPLPRRSLARPPTPRAQNVDSKCPVVVNGEALPPGEERVRVKPGARVQVCVYA